MPPVIEPSFVREPFVSDTPVPPLSTAAVALSPALPPVIEALLMTEPLVMRSPAPPVWLMLPLAVRPSPPFSPPVPVTVIVFPENWRVPPGSVPLCPFRVKPLVLIVIGLVKTVKAAALAMAILPVSVTVAFGSGSAFASTIAWRS
jgi:hypothetical protein